jgi:hypothetical protein
MTHQGIDALQALIISTTGSELFFPRSRLSCGASFPVPQDIWLQSEIAVALKAKHALCFAPLP